MRKNNILIILTLIPIMALSCRNESESKSGLASPHFVTRERIPQDTVQIELPRANKSGPNGLERQSSFESSFLGKTTQDLNSYHLQECLGVIIEQQTDSGKYGVAQYSARVNDCRHGKSKITLEKFIRYFPDGKADFQIMDELTVNSNYPEKCYSTIYLKMLEDGSKQFFLIEHEDNSKPILTKIYKMWEVNIVQERFIERAIPKNFTCLNPNYADGI
ncbi:hypothetical protein [Sphingobacterium sp.]|uniref:hypothetical protein n=1 Tax=Sphingobacterium sp. TaxID=341027 RepID=UPI002FDC9E6C